jgi:hypothetical protein
MAKIRHLEAEETSLSQETLTQGISVKNTPAITVIGATPQASIFIDAGPSAIRAILLPATTAIVRGAKTSAIGGVRIAGLVREVANLIAGATSTGAAATS